MPAEENSSNLAQRSNSDLPQPAEAAPSPTLLEWLGKPANAIGDFIRSIQDLVSDPSSPAELPPLPHDIASPETFLPGTPWWHHALIGLGIAVVLAIVIFFIVRKLRKNKPEVISTTSPFDTADKKLQELKEATEAEPVGKIATQSSLILRECFGIILREQVLFETGEEIKLRPNSFANAPETLRPDLIQLLESLGEAKYAPSQINAAQSEDWISQSSEILSKLKRKLGEKAEETQPSA